MAATWTANRTWSIGELVTSAIMNQYVRDNLDWLKTPVSSGNINFSSDFTTTSAAFVDITGVTTTFTTNGGGVDVKFRCTIVGSGTALTGFLLLMDGVAITGGLLGRPDMLTTPQTLMFEHHIPASYPMAAGSHTFKIQAKTAAGTLTIYGTAGSNGDPWFYVREAGE